MSTVLRNIEGLPGEELIRKGMSDLDQGTVSAESLLVSIARSRLARAGLPISKPLLLDADPEIVLYQHLCRSHPGDAYSRYNSLLRRLVSFTRALAS